MLFLSYALKLVDIAQSDISLRLATLERDKVRLQAN